MPERRGLIDSKTAMDLMLHRFTSHVIPPREARPAMQPMTERIGRVAGREHPHLNPSIGQISDRTGDPQAQGFGGGRSPKGYSLYPAADDAMPADEIGRCRWLIVAHKVEFYELAQPDTSRDRARACQRAMSASR